MLEDAVGSSHGALAAAAIVASLGVMIAALEDLATARDFRPTGLMSWEICRLRLSVSGVISDSLDAVFQYGTFRALLALRVVAGAAVATGAALGELLPAAIVTVLVTSLALSIRCPYGLDGAHQMHLVIFGSLFLASLSSTDTRICTAVSMFIGAQALLAYTVSGTAKLASGRWRSGDAIAGVMATNIYGNANLYELLQKRRWLAQLSCWAVIVFECSFPAAGVLGSPYLEVFLGAGVVFHALTALVMGLNGFFFAFLATYPCVVYLPVAWTDLEHWIRATFSSGVGP